MVVEVEVDEPKSPDGENDHQFFELRRIDVMSPTCALALRFFMYKLWANKEQAYKEHITRYDF